jgi:hypothetical protein
MAEKVEVKPKKRVNSKAKGNSGERVICKMLAEHLVPFKFVRSQSSGAIVGGKNFAANAHLYSQESLHYFVSDIVCSNEADVGKKFRFVVESKAYKTMEKWELLFNGKSQIYRWLDQVKEDAAKVSKEGIVIFKYNGSKHYVAVDRNTMLPNVESILQLPTGDKLCLLSDLLKFKEFWVL